MKIAMQATLTVQGSNGFIGSIVTDENVVGSREQAYAEIADWAKEGFQPAIGKITRIEIDIREIE